MLQRYGISDDDAFTVGLTCGGVIDIFVEAISATAFPEFGSLATSIQDGEPVALATVTAGRPGQVGRHLLVWPESVAAGSAATGWTNSVRDDARGMLAGGLTGTLHYGLDGQGRGEGLSVFVSSLRRHRAC